MFLDSSVFHGIHWTECFTWDIRPVLGSSHRWPSVAAVWNGLYQKRISIVVLLCGCTEQTDRCLELNTDLKYICQEQSGVCSVCDTATGGEVIAKIPRRHISQKKFRLKLGDHKKHQTCLGSQMWRDSLLWEIEQACVPLVLPRLSRHQHVCGSDSLGLPIWIDKTIDQ